MTAIPTGSTPSRARLSAAADGPVFAYRHDEVISTQGDEVLAVAQDLYPGLTFGVERLGPFTKVDGIPDPVRLVRQLECNSIQAQPNHLQYGHSVNQVRADQVRADQVRDVQRWADPDWAELDMADHDRVTTEVRSSSARPIPPAVSIDGITERLRTPVAPDAPHVIVLDTGLADCEFRPRALKDGSIRAATDEDMDRPDENGDGILDPTAGHGTFIGGLIGQIAPGCPITIHRVLSTFGEGDEWAIANCLTELVIPKPNRTILSLSFGGYVMDHPHLLAWAIRTVRARGVTVVASAGNDASDRPTFPAAFPDVISVGALGPAGPAPFSNYGSWVNACAPGVDLLSTFFQGFNGRIGTGPDGIDGDAFNGWALWSGTSFSAPVVAATLAKRMLLDCTTCDEAVERVMGAPMAMRIPNLGLVVNAL